MTAALQAVRIAAHKMEQLPFYALCPPATQQHPALAHYVTTSCVVQSAHFNEQKHCYSYRTADGGGALVHCGGLVEALRIRYYPHVDAAGEAAKKRRWKRVKVQGSNAATGKRIDAQLMWCVTGNALALPKPLPPRPHKWTKALLAHWRALGHTLQAAQLPVVVAQWARFTQADMITRDAKGALWLWEVKTGVPVGATRKNGTFALAPFASVPCTKYAQWQLQLYYTRKALEESAGLQFAGARVIQVYGEKGRPEPIVKVHDEPAWIRALLAPQPPPRIPQEGPLDRYLKRRKTDPQEDV